MMNRFISCIIVIFLFASCLSLKNVTNKQDWIFAFKAQACTSCLISSGADFKKDNSYWLRFEALGGGEKFINKADSLGKDYAGVINEKASYFKGGDMEGGKAITNGCLIFFSSKELNSKASLEYRRYLEEVKKEE